MSRPLSAAVVVCAASVEHEPLLRTCVDSLLEGARRPDEILVVVDHNPALEASVASWLPCSARLLRSPAPGISASRNAGLRAARSDIVAFVDDDAVAEPDWLHRLLQQFSDAKRGAALRYGPARIRSAPAARVRHHIRAARIGWKTLVLRCVSEGLSKARLRQAVERIAAARPRSRVSRIARHLRA